MRDERPADLDAALAAARSHARSAASEAVAAARALLEAASFATTGRPVGEAGPLALVMRSLDELALSLAEGGSGPAAQLLDSVVEALDAEIARWEERAKTDDDARAVLRAYLGLREILWELGVRPQAARRADPKPRAPRVQRVRVDGAT